jgi:dihydroneopterin aldolase
MSDRIEIRGLLVAARVGVPDLERSIPQRLEIDITLTGDFRDLGDDLSRTTDYAAVADWVRRKCAEHEFRLIESLADRLAGGLLGKFPAVAAVRLKIRKFILPGTRHVAVSVERDGTGKNS